MYVLNLLNRQIHYIASKNMCAISWDTEHTVVLCFSFYLLNIIYDRNFETNENAIMF